MHVYLMGMTGCGKTYWGRYAAKLFQQMPIDLDTVIEDTLGCTINEAITSGKITWEEFRLIESDQLRQVSLLPQPAIISLGGGTPCYHNNMGTIKNTGLSVYLECDLNVLYERLKQVRNIRPLIRALNDTELLHWLKITFGEREPYYTQADITTNALAPDWEGIRDAMLQAG